MDYKLQPLTMQQVNWPVYIEMYTELFNTSPTRVLDESGIALDRPQAFLRSIDEYFKGQTHQHISFSFIGTASDEMLLELQNNTDVHILSVVSVEERSVRLFIASATIQVWERAVVALCHKDHRRTVRKMGNQFLMFLEMAGYKFNLKKVQQQDGTYSI